MLYKSALLQPISHEGTFRDKFLEGHLSLSLWQLAEGPVWVEGGVVVVVGGLGVGGVVGWGGGGG